MSNLSLGPGMDKLLVFPGKTDQGIFTYAIDHERRYLEKTAAEYHPAIARYINEARPLPGITQILLTALGAYEFWGDNANGDAFEEQYLAPERSDWGHKTFETCAKIYKHHVNKDPSASFGDVALAVYNPAYRRVELIVLLKNERAPDIINMMDNGDYPSWSMGCRVPYDICSVCGNKAPNRRYYCDHLRYGMGRMDPETGKKAFAFNPYPRFFDISQVLIGADRIAKTLQKVASSPSTPKISSAYLADKSLDGYHIGSGKLAEVKKADMDKEIPVEIAPESKQTLRDLATGITEVKASEPPMPRELVDKMGGLPLKNVLATLASMFILPKPQEFQRIILIRLGRRDVADDLERSNLCFDPEMADGTDTASIVNGTPNLKDFDPMLFEDLKGIAPDRSYASPHLSKRIAIMIKQGANEPKLPRFIKNASDLERERKPVGVLPMLMAAAGLYAAFASHAPKEGLKGLDKLIGAHPGLAAALGVGLVTTFNQISGPKQKGRFDQVEMQPNQDIFSRIEELKQKPYTKVAGIKTAIGPAASRLFLGIPATYMASGVLQKHRDINPYEQEGRIKSFIRRNPDVVSGALIADAMLSLRGKGTHRLISSVSGKAGRAKSYLSKAINAVKGFAKSSPVVKTAEIADVLSNAAIWPVVLGKGNLPARMITSFVDQAIIDGGLNWAARKNKKTL